MSAALGVVVAGVLIAAITDVRQFKVYNSLTLPLLASGLIYHLIVGGLSGLGGSACGALFGFVVLIIPYIMGAMGAGDVKLAAGIGAWLGTTLMVPILVIGLAATAVYSLAVLCWQRRLRDAWLYVQLVALQAMVFTKHLLVIDEHETVQEIVKQPDRRHRLIPFSVMLGIGVVVTLAWTMLGGADQ